MSNYTFFWSGPFSNWYPAKFNADVPFYATDKIIQALTHFNCSEQYMMYMKAMTFNDYETASKILYSDSPKEQKALGRTVKNFDAAVWDKISYDIVYTACKHKFTQNPQLLKALHDTEGTILVEASPYDKIWGIGMAEGDPGIEDEKNWKGENRLGKVLTQLRIQLKYDTKSLSIQ